MRILHSADWHLGQTLHGFDRVEEHKAALDALLEHCRAAEADALIVAGDVYHAANPPLDAQRMFFDFLRRFRQARPKAAFIAIAGNHDSGSRLELPLALGAEGDLRILGAPPRKGGRPDPAAALSLIEGAAGDRAALLALPYPRPGDLSDLGRRSSENESEDAENAPEDGAAARPVRAFLAEGAAIAARRWPGAPLIVVAHAHVAGAAVSERSERRIVIGGEEALPLADFPASAAYVALGHLHRPQTVSEAPLTRYAGAPIPLSFDESAYAQSASLLTLGAGGALEIETLPLPRARAFLRVPEKGAAPLDALEAALAALAERLSADPEAEARPPFLEVAASLAQPEPDLRRRVEAALGDAPVRLARIVRESPARTGAEAAADAPAARPPSPAEAFLLLHEAKFGEPPEPALAAAFAELAQSVANEDSSVAADRAATAPAAAADPS